MRKTTLGLIFLGSSLTLLSGCAAVGTAVSHANLQTQTMMSKSVFLDPVPNREKTIYLQVRNTTDHPDFTIKSGLEDALEDKGYRVVQNYSKAHYLVQINMLHVGRSSKTAAKEMMGKGYGGAAEGVVAGAMISNHPVAGGIVGGLAGAVIDNAVKDVVYSSVVDVKITEKKTGTKKVYTTRIASTADKVNLKFADAQYKLQQGLIQSISGIF